MILISFSCKHSWLQVGWYNFDCRYAIRLNTTCFISSTGDIFFTMDALEILQRQETFCVWDKRSNLHFLHFRFKYFKGKNSDHIITVQQIVTWIFNTNIYNSVLCKTKGVSRQELFDKFKVIALKLNFLLRGQILYSSRSLSKNPLYFAGEAHLKLSKRSWMTFLFLDLKISSLKNHVKLQSQTIGLPPSFLKNETGTALEPFLMFLALPHFEPKPNGNCIFSGQSIDKQTLEFQCHKIWQSRFHSVFIETIIFCTYIAFFPGGKSKTS